MIFGRVSATVACLQLLISGNGHFHVEGRKGFGGTEQEWGYANVKPYAKMFWWLYYTTSAEVTSVYDKPLIIWLQGGPGASSTGFGNFGELGPLDLDLKPRNTTLVEESNVLFIDSPVGTGYSYSENYIGYAKNIGHVASDLLQCMRHFYAKDPKWLNVQTFVLSEGYGGKAAVELALIWNKAQKLGTMRSNFRGILLIDPWISPIDSVLSWAPFLLQNSIIDKSAYKRIEAAAVYTKLAVDNKLWPEATERQIAARNLIHSMAVDINFYNVLYGSRFDSPMLPDFARDVNENRRLYRTEVLLDTLMNSRVNKILGLNVTWGAQRGMVFDILSGDHMKPATDKVERLLNETEITVFVVATQLDLLIPAPGTAEWVEKLAWKDSVKWRSEPRTSWFTGLSLQGYRRLYDQLGMFWVKRSGLMMPIDNYSNIRTILSNLRAATDKQLGSKNKI